MAPRLPGIPEPLQDKALKLLGVRLSCSHRILTGEAGQTLVSANTVCADTVTSRTAASEADAMAKMKGPDRVRAALDAASLECGIRTLPDSTRTGEWSYESG